jgi:hypothetical protein
MRIWKHHKSTTMIFFFNFIFKLFILVAKQQHSQCYFDQYLTLCSCLMQFTLNSNTWSVVYSTIFQNYNLFCRFSSLTKTFLQKITKIWENWSQIILIKNPQRVRILNIDLRTMLFSINVVKRIFHQNEDSVLFQKEKKRFVSFEYIWLLWQQDNGKPDMFSKVATRFSSCSRTVIEFKMLCLHTQMLLFVCL